MGCEEEEEDVGTVMDRGGGSEEEKFLEFLELCKKTLGRWAQSSTLSEAGDRSMHAGGSMYTPPNGKNKSTSHSNFGTSSLSSLLKMQPIASQGRESRSVLSSLVAPKQQQQQQQQQQLQEQQQQQQQRRIWEDSIPSLMCRRCFQFDCITHRRMQINGDGGEKGMAVVDDILSLGGIASVPCLAGLPLLDVTKLIYSGVRISQLPHAPHSVRAAAIAFLHPGDKASQVDLQRICKLIEDGNHITSVLSCLGPQCPKVGSSKVYPSSYKQATIMVQKKRMEAEGQLYALVPCSCVGACGKDDCSCSSRGHYCDRFCKCPSDCPLRYPGCHCGPGQCGTKSCACVALGRECDPIFCQCQCPAHDGECSDGCKNMMVQERYIPHANFAIAPFPGLHLSISEIPGAGWGLFATRPITKGHLICEYSGERISQEEGDRRGLICDRFNQSYLFQADKETVIDAQRFGNVARFINHSCKKPNCMVRVVQIGGVHTVCIFAAQDINAGHELFFDYNHGRAGLAPDWLEKERDKAAELLSLREQSKNSKQMEHPKSGKQKQVRDGATVSPVHVHKKQKSVSGEAAGNGFHSVSSVSGKKKNELPSFAIDTNDLLQVE
jgi:hypothetical protein